MGLLMLAMLATFSVRPAQANETELVVWMWSAHVTALHQTWQQKIKTWFEEENPGVTVRFEFTDTASGEKLIAAAAAGVPPDVTLVSLSRGRDFYERGILRELNNYIDKTPEVALDQFLPVSVIAGQKDGTVFGLPWSLEAKALQYNRDHLTEAGLDARPGAMASWDDMVEYSRRLVQRDANGVITRSGMVLGRGGINFTAYLHSNGGQFYNETGTAVAFNDSKGIEALEMMRRFQHEYDVTRPNAAWADLANRTASMVIGDTSATGRLRAAAPDFESWVEMVAIPPGPQGERPSTVSWSNLFAIPTGAKNPDIAWDFIAMWLSAEKVVERFNNIGGASLTTPRRDFFQTDAFLDAIRRIPYMANMPDIFGNAGPYPHIRYPDISRALTPLLTQAERDGTMAPAAALAEAERIANVILSE